MEQRRAREPLVALPARPLVHRDVDLHLAAAVTEAARRVADVLRCVALPEQPAIQLRRRHAGEHGARGGDRLAVREPDGGRATLRDEDPLDVRLGPQLAACVADDRRQTLDELDAAALRHRHPSELEGAGDHLRHEARHRLVGTESRMQHPRRQQAAGALVLERLGQPVARGEQRVACELDQPAAAVVRVGLAAERKPGAGPELGPEHAERDLRARHELVELPLPRVAQLGDVRCSVGREECARAVRERGGRRQVGVQVLEAECVEIRLQLGIGRRADPQRMPGGEDLVREAGCREVFDGLDRAAEPVVALEHADAPALFREQRTSRERVDAATDEDRVEPRHAGDSTRLTCHEEICV